MGREAWYIPDDMPAEEKAEWERIGWDCYIDMVGWSYDEQLELQARWEEEYNPPREAPGYYPPPDDWDDDDEDRDDPF